MIVCNRCGINKNESSFIYRNDVGLYRKTCKQCRKITCKKQKPCHHNRDIAIYTKYPNPINKRIHILLRFHMDQFRICPYCNIKKSITLFPPRRERRFGYGRYCIQCTTPESINRRFIQKLQYKNRRNIFYTKIFNIVNKDERILLQRIRSRIYKKRRNIKKNIGGNPNIKSVEIYNKMLKQEFLCAYCLCDIQTRMSVVNIMSQSIKRVKLFHTFHVDHIIPLAHENGYHILVNLCISCPNCNLRKSTKLIKPII